MYYDGTKLLSMRDIKNEEPEIYMCSSNRSAGKTTYFNRLLVRRFLKSGEKFMLLYRFNYEVENVASKFFDGIKPLFFKSMSMSSFKRMNGVYHELKLDNSPCGYAVSLNHAEQIKKFSHMFYDVGSMLMDEFQSENNSYCDNEIHKFISIHNSVSRGDGKQSRRVPVYMLSNPVTIINPYYVAMGVCDRIKPEVKFLRGDGWVLEQNFNEAAHNANKESKFNSAFAGESYSNYNAKGSYLNDCDGFIEKISGNKQPVCNIVYNGVYLSLWLCDSGIYYVTDKKASCQTYSFSVDNHTSDTTLINRSSVNVVTWRYYFENGFMYFSNMKSKSIMMRILSY